MSVKTFDNIEQEKAFKKLNEENKIDGLVSFSKCLEADIFNGHSRRYWNPKIKDFVYSRGRGLTFIPEITYGCLIRAYLAIREAAANKKDILIVGTKNKSITKYIASEAERVGDNDYSIFYINKRWIGGTITNYDVVTRTLRESERKREFDNTTNETTNKRLAKKQKEREEYRSKKADVQMGGIRGMRKSLDLVIITDPIAEKNAVQEIRKTGAKIIALTGANADPRQFDFPIPCNVRNNSTQWLLLSILCDAVIDGKKNGKPLKVVGLSDDKIHLPIFNADIKKNESVVKTKKFGRPSNR